MNDFKVLSEDIFDLDIHYVGKRGHFYGHYHYDICYILQATSLDYLVSDESYDLAWVSLEKLEHYNDEETMLRMRKKVASIL